MTTDSTEEQQPAASAGKVVVMDRVKNATGIKEERAWLTALATAALPGLFNFDVKALHIPVVGRLRRMRITSPGWGRMSIEQISFASSTVPGRASYTLDCSTPGALANADPFVSLGLTTKWLRDPWMEVVFSNPPHVGTLRLRSRSAPIATRSVIVDLEDDNGVVRRYRHPSPDRYEIRLTDFQRRAHVIADLGGRCAGAERVAESFMKACNELCAAILQVMGEPTSDLAPLQKLRQETLLECTRLLRAIDGRALGLVGSDAAWCLDQLLARPPAVEEADPADLAVPAVAYVLLAELLKSSPLAPRVKAHPIVTRYRSLFSRTTEIEYLESLVSERYDAVISALPFQPLKMRVHNISGPELARRADSYIAAMHELQLLIQSLGFEICICYGTLLGAVRERDFIAHDDDVDMAVVLDAQQGKSAFLKLVDHLNHCGFMTIYDKRFFARVTPPGRDQHIDLFPIVAKDSEHVEMHMEGMKIRQVPLDYVLPLGQIEFRGMTFSAPRQPEQFLEDRYGSDWQTPRRKMGHVMAEE